MKTCNKNLLGAALLSFAVSGANAAPIQLNLTGTVTQATGVWASNVNESFSASLIIDLDSSNAYSFEVISPVDEAPWPRWTFFGAPYQTVFSADFVSLTDKSIVETSDNFDADANGNPFGVTGIIDGLGIYGSNVAVDCSNGTVDPVTGCSDPDAPWLYGNDFGVVLMSTSDWISGYSLPGSIPGLNDLIGVYGFGESWSGGVMVGRVELAFNSVTVSAVPVPAAAWLFGSGLLGLISVARRKAT